MSHNEQNDLSCLSAHSNKRGSKRESTLDLDLLSSLRKGWLSEQAFVNVESQGNLWGLRTAYSVADASFPDLECVR